MSQINCPTCGAKTNSVIANCEYCCVEISRPAQLNPQDYVKALAHSIEEAKRKAKAEGDFSGMWSEWIDGKPIEVRMIKNFPIPSDISTLTEFFIYCHGNVQTGIESMSADSGAWSSKAKAAYDRLRLASLNAPQLSSFLEEFKSSYSADAMKARGKLQVLIYGTIVIFILLLYILGYFITRK